MTIRARFLLTVLLAWPLHAATVTFTLARAIDVTDATIVLRRISDVEDLKSGKDVRRPADLSEALPPFDLAPGHWSVRVESGRIWHSAQFFTVNADTALTLDVWESAHIAGKLRWKDKAPSALMASFEPVSKGGPSGVDEPCTVTAGSFRCTVPAAPVDLRLRAPGFISIYFWALALSPGETRNAGSVALRAGQSITGRLELPRDLRNDIREVLVRAEPSGLPGMRPTARLSLLPLSGQVNARGYFHIDGVPPGEWTIRARHRAKAVFAPPVTLTVRPDTDTALPQTLLLDRPRRLQVFVAPALDPAMHPWTLELTREVVPGRVEPVQRGPATITGLWTVEGLLPGRYGLTVSTSDGDEWHREDFVQNSDLELSVVLDSRMVRGKITFGDRPLDAKLAFSNAAGGNGTTRSDEEGKFTVRLPDSAERRWDIDVLSEEPAVKRVVRDVDVVTDRELAIRIPTGRLRGEVVDEAGEPIPYPLVHFLKSGTASDVTGTEAGTFAIAGLDPGPNILQADGPDETQSEQVAVEFPESGDGEPVRLVVVKGRTVRGLVMSQSGPIPGARVWVMPTDVPPSLSRAIQTDARGHFLAHIPRAATQFDVFVNAAGFSYMMDHAAYQDSVLEADVDQSGGTLVVRGADRLDDLYAVHGGAIQYVDWMIHEAGGTRQEDALTIPRLEPGPYALCVVAADAWSMFRATTGAAGGRCATGVLPPNGTLSLDLPRD